MGPFRAGSMMPVEFVLLELRSVGPERMLRIENRGQSTTFVKIVLFRTRNSPVAGLDAETALNAYRSVLNPVGQRGPFKERELGGRATHFRKPCSICLHGLVLFQPIERLF